MYEIRHMREGVCLTMKCIFVYFEGSIALPVWPRVTCHCLLFGGWSLSCTEFVCCAPGTEVGFNPDPAAPLTASNNLYPPRRGFQVPWDPLCPGHGALVREGEAELCPRMPVEGLRNEKMRLFVWTLLFVFSLDGSGASGEIQNLNLIWGRWNKLGTVSKIQRLTFRFKVPRVPRGSISDQTKYR